MSTLTVPLTVRSVNNVNVTTAYTEIFPVDRMYGIRSNQNANNSMTFTDSNSAANTVDHTSWTFTFRGERPTLFLLLCANKCHRKLEFALTVHLRTAGGNDGGE